ncbi:pseudouridine synthase [Dissoconium aciculare CBS 342.82]|uniref:Pseudouridine synthase n=1 Tax=Dissoconium aciculare CBS 342.82 TaxID=1314786 RepID=A0A6J3MCM5_9PEZI|nr:pseudouridine synthase [Dissoconium aciculare CBS 342.82]KAF1825344.1 pseudouridine synthase [Dissoconium aciculare CBS 342.82]
MTSPPDYTSWSHADLIQRVSELEVQLRAKNDQVRKITNGPTSSSTSHDPPRKKPRKAPKQFDPSRYTTRLIALKFAYLGGNYNGFEHHTNNTTPLPTIEEEVWRALHKTRLIFPTRKVGQREDEVTWDGCDYSKCGRTDRGVSAFGQVIGIRVRSNRPKPRNPAALRQSEANAPDDVAGVESDLQTGLDSAETDVESTSAMVPFDDVRDEIPYVQMLNKVLPPDIRMLAWCARPPPDFSARFDCRERRYRYFFTNPAFYPMPERRSEHDKLQAGQTTDEGWLDIEAMGAAAKKYEGLHDFRNFCKVDPSKQITNFQRRIFHAGIHRVHGDSIEKSSGAEPRGLAPPELYYFEVRGSAFLWHQVRHLVAVLFLVGQGFEAPAIVDTLLDISRTPAKPLYEMASDVPLVLWDCIFPAREEAANGDYASDPATVVPSFENAMEWIYNDSADNGQIQILQSKDSVLNTRQRRDVLMDDLWALWRKRRIDEVLAWGLMGAVAMQDRRRQPASIGSNNVIGDRSDRIFDGGEASRTVGTYIPITQRACMEEPDVVNARYATRKGKKLDSKGPTPEGTEL